MTICEMSRIWFVISMGLLIFGTSVLAGLFVNRR
jgi:hypothetical protein